MTATVEPPLAPPPPGVLAPTLRIVASLVLANVALIALARLVSVGKVLAKAGVLWGPPMWATTGALAKFALVVILALAVIAWLKPWRALATLSTPLGGDDDSPQRAESAAFVLGNLLLLGLAGTVAIMAVVLFKQPGPNGLNPLTFAFVALNLLVAGGAIWGFRRLKPWSQRKLESPSTRRTNTLFGLSALVSIPGVLTLALVSSSETNPFGLMSNSPVPLWVALFAIASWVLGMWLGWKWYFSADEHEREAYDFGSVVGAGIFTALAPAWWVAARGGLVPHPDPMVLWGVTMIAISLGWIWRRSR